jgi:pSer/pThr/pTyr-binding forkhead associated (FHA) protein
MRPVVSLTVIREDKPIDKLYLEKKNKFFLGSHQSNDFKLDHPSISKTHACIYFSPDLNLMLVDLGSSNGTTLTREGQPFKLEPLKPVSLEKNDLITFGLSSRKYKVEIDCSIVEQYVKEQQSKVEEEIKRIKERKASRSRSRSPKHKKNRN